MDTPTKRILPHSHADMSLALKVACAQTSNNLRHLEISDKPELAKEIEYRNIKAIDRSVVGACVDFLTMGNASFDKLLNQHLPGGLFRYFPKPVTYHKAMMTLRGMIASGVLEPWNEGHVHSWLDFSHGYATGDEHHRKSIDMFFSSLIDTPYSAFEAPFLAEPAAEAIAVPNKSWIAVENIDYPIRLDLSAGLFSVSFGAEGKALQSYSAHSAIPHRIHDVEQEDELREIPLKKIEEFPRLNVPRIRSFGTRFSSLKSALTSAMSVEISPESTRIAHVFFKGEKILVADVQPGSFTPKKIFPITEAGVNLSKTVILNTIDECQAQTKKESRYNDLLMSELGL
jgi:hypothetical protein